MRLGTRRAQRLNAIVISSRAFEARPAHNTLPPEVPIKKAFNYDHIWPYDDERDRIWFDGGCMGHNDYLEKHYLGFMWWRTPEYNLPNPGYVGYYGPYWPAHLGYGHQWLKRRTAEPADYSKGGGNPILHFIRRKIDERGWDGYYPCGQGAHYIPKWFVWVYLLTCANAFYGLLKQHRATNKPAEAPEEKWAPVSNVPFFIYEEHGIPIPNVF